LFFDSELEESMQHRNFKSDARTTTALLELGNRLVPVCLEQFDCRRLDVV